MTTYTKITYHASHDRIDRLAACIEHLGVGQVVLEETKEEVIYKLTSTGLCLLYGVKKQQLITGFMCPMNRCIAMYRSCGYNRVPQNLYNTITRNEKNINFYLICRK